MVANGAGDVLSIKIAKEIVDPDDVEILEDLVLSGVQQAIAKGKEMASSEMTKITGGMPPAWAAWACRAGALLVHSR